MPARQEAGQAGEGHQHAYLRGQGRPKLNSEQKEAQIARLEDFGQKRRLEPLPENYALVERLKGEAEGSIMNFE